MPLNLNSADTSNLTNAVSDITIDTKQVDGVQETEETEWQNSKWTQQWGYFNAVPDLKSAMLMKSIWTTGRGWTADPETTVILDHISGWGKDTFDDVIFNADLIKRVGGDSFAEIIKDEETGTLINLKPLDPGSMKIVVNRQGMIKKFIQTSKTKGGANKEFEPEEIFYLSNNRLADQIHGISDIDVLEKTILAENENFEDMKKIMHRQARPMIMFKVGTDDTTKISNFITKMDDAVNKGENIYIPDDVNSVSYEVVQINISATILEWRNDIRNKFYRAIGLPQIVPGGGGQSTESESKVIYLAFEQLVERDQRYLEKQIWNQLGLKINFEHPASLSQDLQRDIAKDGMTQQMTAEMNPAGVAE